MLFSLISLVLLWAEDIQSDINWGVLLFCFVFFSMKELSTKFFSVMNGALEKLLSIIFSQEKEKLI